MKTSRLHRGFVLLIVLLVLAICATVLAAAIRRSAQRAIEANNAERHLQIRWGGLSIRMTILPQAERLLKEQEKAQQQVLTETRRTITLNGVPFHLVLADEQAKANANRLAQEGGMTGLMNSLRRLQLDQRQMLAVRLRPIDDAVLRDEAAREAEARQAAQEKALAEEAAADESDPSAPNVTGQPRRLGPRAARPGRVYGLPGVNLARGPNLVAPPPGQGGALTPPLDPDDPTAAGEEEAEAPLLERFRSFDQLFDVRHPSQLVGTDEREGSIVRNRVTCWGSGRVNFRRADPAVLGEVLAGVLSRTQLGRLEDLRQTKPDLTLAEAMAQLQVDDEGQKRAERLVTDSSQTYSLWMVVDDLTRLRYSLHVRQGLEPETAKAAAEEELEGGVSLEELGPLTPEQVQILRDAGVLKERKAGAGRPGAAAGEAPAPPPGGMDPGIGDPELGALQPGEQPPPADGPVSENEELIRHWSYFW